MKLWESNVPKSKMPQTANDAAELLSVLRVKRRYLLPHHGLMAVAAPELLTAYDATYTAAH